MNIAGQNPEGEREIYLAKGAKKFGIFINLIFFSSFLVDVSKRKCII